MPSKRALVAVCTQLQLFVSINLALNGDLAEFDEVELCIFPEFEGAAALKDNEVLRELFTSVEIYAPTLNPPFPQMKDFLKYFFRTRKKQSDFIEKWPLSKKGYDAIFCANPRLIIDPHLFLLNERGVTHFIEEGAGSYDGSIASSFCVSTRSLNAEKVDLTIRNRIKRILKKLFERFGRSRKYFIQPNFLHLFNTEVVEGLYLDLEVKKIDRLKANALNTLESLFPLKSRPLYQSNKIIFLGTWNDSMSEADQLSLAQHIALRLNENIIYRPHPHNQSVDSEKPSVLVDRMHDSWEMLCLEGCISEEEMIFGFCSSAQFMPKSIYGIEPRIILLNKMMKDQGPTHQGMNNAVAYMRKMYVDQSKISVPADKDELDSIIDMIMSEFQRKG